MTRPLLCCSALLVLLSGSPPTASASIPSSWPLDRLALGMRDDEGQAAALRASTRLQIRYHYLSGGANTGSGWSGWSQGGGSFVSGFIDDSAAHGFLPVLSLYQIRESAPGKDMAEEAGDLANLASIDTMTAYLKDVRLLFQKAGATGQVAVLHVEPDLWGYIERRAGSAGAANVPVQISTTGLAELQGLPNTAAGLAQAFARLRDAYAPKVLLGYHLSVWGTGEDIALSDPSDAHIDELSHLATSYYRSLDAPFDLIFAEQADRDSGYRQVHDGAGDGAAWTPEDFARQARFLRGVSSGTKKAIVLWQLPLGNAAQPNTPKHYRDNRVQTLLGAGGAAVRRAYVHAGVIAMLFGKAQPEATCACDDDGDGRDDDGGLFKRLAGRVIATGTEVLPGFTARPPRTAPSRTTAPSVAVRTTVAHRVPRRGTAHVTVRLTSRQAAQLVVAVQVYQPGAGSTPTFQKAFRGQRLHAGVTRTYRVSYRVPANGSSGHWDVKVGLFDPQFRTLLVWRPDAGRFTVS